jgi:outer membrane biosynthesis protein TonB
MREAVDDVIALRAHDPRGLSRMITWSLVVHVGVLAAVAIAPRDWLQRKKPAAHVMEINLGSSGPKASGVTTIGGRPVDQATPEPKHPEPIKLAAAKPDVMTVPTKTVPPKPAKTPPPAKVIEQAKAPSPVAQPPTTGRQATPGNSRADTGIIGLGSGLQIGGGGQGSSSLLSDFCCNAYLQEIVKRIKNNWQEQQPERGTVVMKFTIQRDGTVTDVAVERPGTFLLNMASQRPFTNLRVPPLPAEYKDATLIIHLTFEYK